MHTFNSITIHVPLAESRPNLEVTCIDMHTGLIMLLTEVVGLVAYVRWHYFLLF